MGYTGGMARPTKCTQDITDEICYRLADGESLRSICADDRMPEKASVLLWVVQERKIDGTERRFSDQYHASREAAGYSHADEALGLRYELREGSLDPQTAKVILDALKWGAERMAPKRHSQRQEIDHQSSDGSIRPTQIILSAPDDDSET